MARRVIPMIAFPRVRTIYIYIYLYLYVCVTYASMRCIRKLRHSRGLGQLMGVPRKRTRSQVLQTSRKKAV